MAHDLIQPDPVHNPDYVIGPGDEVPRLATDGERELLGLPIRASDAATVSGLYQPDWKYQRLLSALRWYANPVNYENASPRHVRPVITDGGAIARKALQGVEDAEA